ncbi:MAG: DUF2058 domain-containing protein [Deltaproteobacteria bacterium]|nr:DUF2058 domain-containing protein [Deltaproteobacteria bacterium]
MNGSLRDQLLKAGLVDQKQARQAELDARQQNKQAHKARKSGLERAPTAADLAAETARQERECHAQRSRELNQAREQERARQAARAEVKQILQTAAVPHGKGEVRYHFVRGSKVKKLYVDSGQQTALTGGLLAIVEWEGAYRLVPTEIARRIRELVPEAFVFLAEARNTEPDPDDPYAAFPIPDDLVW